MKKNLPADEALNRLLEGNRRFIENKLEHSSSGPGRRAELVAGQDPFAVILGCADSRVGPSLVFDQSLGDLFTVRVAGNVVDTSVIASVEYAVLVLGVRLVLVKGHQSCGAVGAAVSGARPTDHIARLMQTIEPAILEARGMEGDLVDNAVRVNAIRAARGLLHASTALTKVAEEDGLKVLPAYYSLQSGMMEVLEG